MKSLSNPSGLPAAFFFYSLLLGTLAAKVNRDGSDYLSVSEEILAATQQQEQLASLQVQAEISNNVSSLEALDTHTSETVQRWCDATETSEQERQRRLVKLIDSKAPDLERIAAREAHASEFSFIRLVTSACKLQKQKQELGAGLRQDQAALQTEGSAKTAATNEEGVAHTNMAGKATATNPKKTAAAAAQADGKVDKAFQAYMASVETGSDTETASGKHDAKHGQDAEEDTATEEVEESDDASQDEAPRNQQIAKAPIAVAQKTSNVHPAVAQKKAKIMAKVQPAAAHTAKTPLAAATREAKAHPNVSHVDKFLKKLQKKHIAVAAAAFAKKPQAHQKVSHMVKAQKDSRLEKLRKKHTAAVIAASAKKAHAPQKVSHVDKAEKSSRLAVAAAVLAKKPQAHEEVSHMDKAKKKVSHVHNFLKKLRKKHKAVAAAASAKKQQARQKISPMENAKKDSRLEKLRKKHTAAVIAASAKKAHARQKVSHMGKAEKRSRLAVAAAVLAKKPQAHEKDSHMDKAKKKPRLAVAAAASAKKPQVSHAEKNQKRPAAVAAAASAKKPHVSRVPKLKSETVKAAVASKAKKHRLAFIQVAHLQMLSQMSLTTMLELFSSYTTPKQAKRWCHVFESKGENKTNVKPLQVANSLVQAEKNKFDKLKVLQVGQKKESKLRLRFAKFWRADAKKLQSLLQDVANSSDVWASNTQALHAASDRQAVASAEARFAKIGKALQLALGERQKNIKEQERKISSLESALADAGQRYQDQEAATKEAESKLEKVKEQISRIQEVCSEIKREGPALLWKGVTQF